GGLPRSPDPRRALPRIGQQLLRQPDILAHLSPLHWLENPFAIPGAEPRAIFLRQAHDEVVLMQADEEVAVGKRCRIAEHFTAGHGYAGRHRLVEKVAQRLW